MKVHYEGWIRYNKAALERLGRGLVDFGAELRDSYKLEAETAILIIKIEPEKVKGFTEQVRIQDFRYRSPVYFDNGTLRPYYKNPEEEIRQKKVLNRRIDKDEL